MLNKTLTSTALILALIVSGFIGVFAPAKATAQEAIEEVVVTGTRIKRSDLSSISPITVLTDAELNASGNMTLENFLQDQPATLGGADYGSSVNNGNPGLATVQLRGLGPNRTLVLVNGQRPPQASTNGYTDLNMIPTAAIERIDLLRDGASTIYGSDAIAGVVNIITKTNFEGLQMDVQYDETSEGDGKQYGMNLLFGTTFDRGHIMLGGQYSERKEILQRDRGFSDCPLQDAPGGGSECGGSGTTTPAQIIPALEADSYVLDSTTGDTRVYNSAGDAYNFAIPSIMNTPQHVYSMFGDASYQIIEAGGFSDLRATMQASFSNRESDQNLAGVGTFWSPQVPASNPFNPFGDVQCAGNVNCSAPQDVAIARRLEESGGRSFNQDASAWMFVLGLDGDFSNGWSWDFSYNYNDWSESSRDGGRAIEPNINGLVDPLCEVNANCTPLAGTGVDPWDPFPRGTLTDAQLAYGTVAVNEISKSRMKVAQLNLNGDLMGKFELPGGEPLWALGYENRTEKASDLPDGGSAIGAVYGTPGNVTSGSYEVDEVYGEISLPILSGVRFAEILTLEASFRWSDYDFVKSDTNYSYKAEWAPISDLRLRASYSDGFRAPNISERFLGQQQTAASYADPCAEWDTSGNPTLIANCGPGGDNLPLGFVVNAPQASTIEGGNPDLEPEKSENYSYGFVYTPSFLDGFSITVDYWDIKIDDAVGTAGTGNVVSACYNSPGFSNVLCPLIIGPTLVGESPSNVAPLRRNAQNQVTGIALNNQNLSSFKTSGWDFQVDYAFDTDWGNFALRAVGTYVDEYKYTAVTGEQELELQGTFQTDPFNKNAITAFPEWAVNYSVDWSRDNWGASLMARWMDETDDGFEGSACGNSCSADSVTYIDLQGYYVWENMTFTVGARNLTDEDPPYVTNYDDMNTLHYSYDTAGTYYYGRYTIKL